MDPASSEKPWPQRVAIYIDQLQQLVEQVDRILQQTEVNVTKPTPAKTNESTGNLQVRLQALEQQIAERESLLHAADAPAMGLTLTEKLRGLDQIELVQAADRVSDRIQLAHQRSMSLFVCQFHLSNLTTDLVRVLTGGDIPATYGGPNAHVSTPQGGLFNKSA